MINTKPSTGVMQTNNAHFLYDDILYSKEYIDIHYEDHMAQKPDDIDIDDWMDEYYDDEFLYYVGIIKGPNGLYDIDYDAEYSAIITPMYTQVLHSKYISYANVCSPCFPGQNNLDDAGVYETYALPEHLYDKIIDTHLEIFEI